MSRIIKTQSGYRVREKILKLIGNAIYDYRNAKLDELNNDIVAFIALLLDEIENSVRDTLDAWEKRDYWVKADQFRSEWRWVGEAKSTLVEAIRGKNDKRIDEIFESLRKDRRIQEGILNPKKGMEYAGSYARFRNKFRTP